MSIPAQRTYSVDLIGFSPADRTVFASTFALSQRRPLRYVQHRDAGARPDLYLVDAENLKAMVEFVARAPDPMHPAILVGTDTHGTGWPAIARPIRWMALFELLDRSAAAADQARSVYPEGARNRWPFVDRRSRPRLDVDVTGTTDYTALRAHPNSTAAGVLGAVATTPAANSDTAGGQAAAATAAAAVASGEAAATAAAAAASGAAPAVPASGNRTGAAPTAAEPCTPVARVLLADTDVQAREVLGARCAGLGFVLDCVSSGEQALALLEQHDYVSVFVDRELEGVDGLELCRRIKARKDRPRPLVVMNNARVGAIEHMRASMAGCDAQFARPIDAERLAEWVPASRAA